MQYNWLALGDSYTIGEGVPLYRSYPYQALELLRRKGLPYHAPEIIARTGWTTSELMEQLARHTLQPAYSLVTLLIGVNNQYRGQALDGYTTDLTWLVQKAGSLLEKDSGKLAVINIPDWGVTPFAEGRDLKKIEEELDAFNAENRRIAAAEGAAYIDISGLYRQQGAKEEMVAEDKLHPSGEMYTLWAELLVDAITGEKNG